MLTCKMAIFAKKGEKEVYAMPADVPEDMESYHRIDTLQFQVGSEAYVNSLIELSLVEIIKEKEQELSVLMAEIGNLKQDLYKGA